ncbi:MAG: ABC transporter permease subunit [Gammaproteobacteria bacterium]|nr:ABC transporter permease subunit [Gammaproteobacteria bacterium]
MTSLAIASYEVRRLLRDRALPALLILLLGLSVYAAWNGADWVQEREAAIGLIRAGDQASLADGRRFVVESYPSVILPITQPVLPPTAMAPVSVGQADAYPFTAETFPLGDYTYLFRRVWADIGSPTVRAAGRFDLAFVIVFLLPLVILATTFDLWSRERERGVAAMVLSQPVAVGPLIAAKALARGLVVLLPSTAIILAVAAWAGAREPIGLTALALAVLAYGGFWLAVAAIISLVARRSTEAAIAAGAVWLLVVVMAPSLTLAAVDLTTPAPSEMRFATDLKARITEITERQRRYREANPAPVRVPAPTIPDRLRGVYADRVTLDREVAPMIAAHHQARDARRQLLDTVRLLLPSVAIQDALDRIAGSDADRALAFENQARAAQSELRLIYKGYLDRDALVTPTEYDNMPGFRFRESGGAFQAGVLADLAALVVATLFILVPPRALRGQAATL